MRNDPANKLSRAAWYLMRDRFFWTDYVRDARGVIVYGHCYQAVVLLARLAMGIRAGRSL